MGPRISALLAQFNAYKARIDALEGVQHEPLVDMGGRPLITLEAEMATLNARAEAFVAKLPAEAVEVARSEAAVDIAASQPSEVTQ
jgi:hypothetical protein